MKSSVLLALVSAIFFAAFAIPAHAQATRTWISGVGDDANPCSRTAPCKTFAGAIAKTAPSGEINCLDPGGFGALTITKAISIICGQSGESGVLVSGTNGITVAAGATDRVVLQGLDFEGLGASPTGVSITSGLYVYIIGCTIQGFTGNGVNMASSTSGGHAFINNSFIMNNGGGVNVAGPNNIASVTNTNILSNSTFGVQANGSGTVVGVETSVINNNPAGISLLSGGQAISVGPSNLVTGTGSFSSTIAYQ